MDIKEIKSEIRALRKLKLKCRAGSKERLTLGRQIKELKNKMVDITKPEPLKEPIITEILRIEAERKSIPTFEQLGIDLHKYTIEQLKKHLQKLNKKRGI